MSANAENLGPNITSSWANDENVTDTTTLKIPSGCIVALSSSPSHNGEAIVSKEATELIEQAIDAYLLMLFFVVSVPLNIVNVIVFWNHGIKERINLCLSVQSMVDAVVMCVYFVLELDRVYSSVTGTEYTVFYGRYVFNHMIHGLVGFIYVSGFMSTLIAFERCLCVVSPLRAQALLPTKTTAVIIVIGHCVILGGYYVIATRYEVVCMFDPDTGQAFDAYYATRFYFDNKEIVDTFEGVVYGVLLPGFYIIGVSIATVLTVVTLRQSKEWRLKSTSVNSSDWKNAAKDVTLTRMLIGANVQFVVCTTPTFLFHTLHPFIPGLDHTGKYHNLYQIITTVQQLCYYVNSSVNFFIYYFFGTKFRTTVRNLLSGCPHKRGGKKSKEVIFSTSG